MSTKYRNNRIDWWGEGSLTDRAQRAAHILEILEAQWADIRRRRDRNYRLYMERRLDFSDIEEEVSRKNPLKAAVDTFVSTVMHNRYRMTFAPVDADPKQRNKVEQLEKFIDGLIAEQGLRYRPFRMAVKDAAVFGVGVFKTFWEESAESNRVDIKIERVNPQTLVYDREAVAEGGSPREIYHIRYLSRDYLCNTYPDCAQEIKLEPVGRGSRETAVERVKVVECWRRTAGKSKGAYAVFMGETALQPPQEIDLKEFPFTFMEFEPDPQGWRLEARGLVDSVAGQQAALEKLTEWCDEAFRTMPRVMIIPTNAGFSPEVVSQLVEKGLHVTEANPGASPWISQPDPVNPQVIQRVNSEMADIFSLSGVSQDNAMAQTPAGMESAKARMIDSNVKSARFAAFYTDVSAFWVELSKSIIRAASDASRAMPDASIEGFIETQGGFYRKVDFKQLELERMQFVIRPQAMAQLPYDIAGQTNLSEQLINMGVLSRAEAIDMMVSLPDVPAVTRRLRGKKTAVELDVQAILNGDAVLPDSIDDLEYAIAYAEDAYLRIRRREVSGDEAEAHDVTLNQLLAYIDAAKAMLPPPPPPVPEGAQPMPGEAPPAI